MPVSIFEELKFFCKNAIKLRNKMYLFIIIGLIIVPFIYYDFVFEFAKLNINKAIRIYSIYIINIYNLILIYNLQVEQIYYNENFEDRPNRAPVPNNFNNIQRDLINIIAEQAGIDINNLIDIEIIDIINFNDPVPLAPGAPLPQNDNQNVHDSTIQTHIINCVNKLKEDKYKGKLHLTNDELINEIKHFIFTSYNGANKIKENALNTLNKMLKINGNIAKLNMSENEILKLVWNRIHNPINKQREQIIKENLIESLADSLIDNNNLYCVQGRAGRIIQSLECADMENIVNLKPLWVVKEEISKQFGKYRNKILGKLSPKHLKIYNKYDNIAPKEQILIDKINGNIIKQIDTKLKKNYIKSGIINYEQYNKITEPYFAEFK